MSEDNHTQRTTDLSGFLVDMRSTIVGSQTGGNSQNSTSDKTDEELFDTLFEDWNNLSYQSKDSLKEIHHRVKSRKENYGLNRKRARRKVLPSRIIQKVHQRIPYVVVSNFVNYIKDYTRDNKIDQFKPMDMGYIVLYVLCYNKNHRDLSYETGINSTKVNDSIYKLSDAINSYLQDNFKMSTYNERKNLADSRIPAHYPQLLRDVTSIVDGCHIRILQPTVHPHFYDPNTPFYSFK